ncbi:competence/damage-inducible protein A [Methyloligella sp. GL2]|nr:competence/damage-inducible protein A [Methyloligella sp. GL2]
MTNDEPKQPGSVTAALLIIGDEILSGRTQDRNIGHIANVLSEAGISLREVRIVPDVECEIIDAVNSLRRRYRYLFTTGGIGPTHDDITTDAIGRAFGVAVNEDERAVEAMRKHAPDAKLSGRRMRMARIPEGATLVDNIVSGAPGYMLENVIVMAGIPRIMQAMMQAVLPRLEKGRKIAARQVRVDAPEGDVAPGLAALQTAFPSVQIGSYPFYEEGSVGTYVVLRSVEPSDLTRALEDLWSLIAEQGFAASDADDGKK